MGAKCRWLFSSGLRLGGVGFNVLVSCFLERRCCHGPVGLFWV